MAADPYGDSPAGETIPQAKRRYELDLLNETPAAPSEPPAPTPGYIPDWAELFKPPAATTAASTGTGGGGGAAQQAQVAAPTPSFAPAQQSSSFTMGAASPITVGQAKAPAITDQLTSLLQQRLTDLSNPLDVTSDPIYQNQIKAFNVQSERDAERARAQLAQRRAVQGNLTSGGFNTGVRSIGEEQGQANQMYAANLAGQRFQQREAQLNQAIALARSVGQDDVALQLENQKLNLQKEALELQSELGFGDLNLRRYLGESQLGLGQDQLGFNYAQLGSNMNRDAILALLGGGGG